MSLAPPMFPWNGSLFFFYFFKKGLADIIINHATLHWTFGPQIYDFLFHVLSLTN